LASKCGHRSAISSRISSLISSSTIARRSRLPIASRPYRVEKNLRCRPNPRHRGVPRAALGAARQGNATVSDSASAIEARAQPLQLKRRGFAMEQVTNVSDSAARRAAKRVELVARKSRWRRDTIDNQGGFQIVDPSRNIVIAGDRYDLTAADVIKFCRLRMSLTSSPSGRPVRRPRLVHPFGGGSFSAHRRRGWRRRRKS
jgi:hypothetical protein